MPSTTPYFAPSNIRYLRKQRLDLTQTEFGKLFDPVLTRGMIDGYERNIAKPSPQTVQAIADYFGVTSDIINFHDIKSNPEILSRKNENPDGLLKAKDKIIRMQAEEIKFLREEVTNLRKLIEAKVS
jgi:transcriptional regulator with XRE-family HTH domain